MKNLESAEDKVQQICEALRHETLEPAKLEAQNLIAEAKVERDNILRRAEEEAEALIAKTRKRLAQEKEVYQTSQPFQRGFSNLFPSQRGFSYLSVHSKR